ncbi:hypothetical protein ACS6Y8_06115 [Streptococcus suis]|uniref:hypothetical protein n=1 Tax=Streptococcus suis TaxID=1307 RepID=UPI000CF5C451|nr:hypothetical protein [Streptococcus suis]MCE6987265.1 hypothetical protein [Streptococcus suis]NQI44128.1 hypothetical protein [Streptococcus suis]NQJ74996.1 hypothetical protein [Streptococcus suis]NQJ79326.1 hypothetical protein [Streptococcus suis]NQK10824.1 hypothetical protein [Streptococcus suis]
MKQYFEKFEEKLKVAEEKLDILSEWHIAKGHKGATEIAEECRTAITALWIEFYGLSEAYKEAEADHEEFYQANVDYLLGELRKRDNMLLENALSIGKGRPNYLLFDYLDREQRIFENPDNLATAPTGNIWRYIRGLIIKDQKERGIL